MAFKQLKRKEREELRQYLEKREDFKSPKTPKIGEFRTYDQNKRAGIPLHLRMGGWGKKGGGGSKAAARWLLGSGGVVRAMEKKKLESKLQSQHIEMRGLEFRLAQAQEAMEAQRNAFETRGQNTLMEALCEVLDIPEQERETVHADTIVGRVQRMRRKNIDGALALFDNQGGANGGAGGVGGRSSGGGGGEPGYKKNMQRLVELLDITTFESGSVEEEIVDAVEKLVRQVKQGGDGEGSDDTDGVGGGAGDRKKFTLKGVGRLIASMNAVEKRNLQRRAVESRKQQLQQKKGAQTASMREVRKFIKGTSNISNDVSLCGLIRGLKNIRAPNNVPSGINVNNTLAALYEAKIIADQRADATGKQRLSMAQYLRTFLVHQYGIKKLAMKQMVGIVKAIKRHRRKVPRLDLFARLVGLEESDEHEYSSLAADYFLVVLVELFRAVSVKKLTGSDELDMTGMLRDGITKKRLLTSAQINEALQNVDMGKGNRDRVLARIAGGKSWCVDTFLVEVMECWYQGHAERLEKTAQVFFDSDENGDGELTLDEFTKAVRVLEPYCPADDIVELYDRIAGEDGVIDAEEFAEGVMLLHSHMIQHQRRIREARREANLKRRASAAMGQAAANAAAFNSGQNVGTEKVATIEGIKKGGSSDTGGSSREETRQPQPPSGEKGGRAFGASGAAGGLKAGRSVVLA